ncbi:hypothetical protein BLNAU_16295 [Blattamonas nauphoetae]|uniref:Uncharacterized protein n=1 Tax=Blattamonas nauphoetae TaxID=2049346 RepID=A0ABQ9XEW3_9EUKA|nr:hypothetical protein BLNAU_16295 [Blattamonas nauphoetae]
MMFEIPNLVSVLFHDSYLSLHSVSASLLFKDQLRMSDVEFGRLSGGLVHSRPENDAEWERTDFLSEKREIGVKLEMENERWLERTNRSDLEHTETSPDSISSDSHHSPLLTPPHSQHLAVPDSPSPPSSHHSITDFRSPLPQTIDSSHFDSHSTSPLPLSSALHTPSPSQHKSESSSHASSNRDKTDRVTSCRHSPQSRNLDQNERRDTRRSSDSLGSTRGSSIVFEEERRETSRVAEQESSLEDSSRHSQDEQDGPGETDEERQVNKSNDQSEIEEGDEMDDKYVHRRQP